MTVSILEKYAVGPKMCHAISFVASAAEENIVTGLLSVDHFNVGSQSITTSFYKMKVNVNSSGAVNAGMLGASGLVAGDQMYIYAYGK